MGPLNLILWAAGLALIVVGITRARGPWARYRVLREEDANIARYEAWRGGLRDGDLGGGSIAMEVLRRQARNGAIIAGAGIVLVFAGFALPA